MVTHSFVYIYASDFIYLVIIFSIILNFYVVFVFSFGGVLTFICRIMFLTVLINSRMIKLYNFSLMR